jgi:catechol 2,3-dioxygenase-like lactoylglutathione lyase family enzyme
MLPLDYNHIAILVNDLDAAIRQFGSFGMRFASRRQETQLVRYESHDELHDLAFTYSTRAPYVELVQSAGSGLFSARNAGVHHVGGFGDPAPSSLEGLPGVRLVAEMRTADGKQLVAAMFTLAHLPGVLIEQVDTVRQDRWRHWLEGSDRTADTH